MNPKTLQVKLRSGVIIQIGEFSIKLKSHDYKVADALASLYNPQQFLPDDKIFIDFHIDIRSPSLLRRFIRPQTEFILDGKSPFKPLPKTEAFPLFEWGLNWCIATHAHHYFMLHSAVLEKNGKGLILPAPPGSGKSTLCAELAFKGWRLLSDEFALISHDAKHLTPLVRPISLKNQSIDIIQGRNSDVTIGSIVHNTSKGTVAHVKPKQDWLTRQFETANPAWIIFPQYKAGSDLKVTRLSQSDAFMQIVSNSFNYAELGIQGFNSAISLAKKCQAFQLTYSSLDEALEFFNNLAEGRRHA